MKDLINFIQPQVINEGVSNAIFDKYINTIRSYVRKYDLFTSGYVCPTEVVGGSKLSYALFIFSVKSNVGVNVLWDSTGNQSYVSSLAFVKDANKYYDILLNGGSYTYPFVVELKDMSIAQLLPFIVKTLNDNAGINPKKLENDLHDLVSKAGMFESQEEADNMVNEEKTEYEIALSRARGKIQYYKDRGQTDNPKYLEAVKALEDLKSQRFSIKKNVKAKVQPEFKEIEKQEEEYLMKATPEERFSDMEHYISMVVKGLQPSLLICGAPGVGKTFRVMKAIKASGLNYKVIKGKETAMACYCDLFLYSREGDILIFDDADDVLENDVITNLLKAATDSSDERIVSYGTSKPPMMTQEEFMSLPLDLQSQCSIQEIKGGQVYFYPKNFETKGRVLIITNKNAGQIDTAVRNRGLVCDLAFTTEECLEIIEGLLPHIMPGKLSQPAKVKALDYLQNLANKGSKMEISIRSFTTVAKVYEDVDDEGQAERMIREQMYLQSLRGGKKY